MVGCVIHLFGGVLVLSLCTFDIFVGIGVFVIGLSQLSSFFSSYYEVFYALYVPYHLSVWNMYIRIDNIQVLLSRFWNMNKCMIINSKL